MGHGTAFLVAGAVAVALALGGLVGGVLAERPAAAPTSAPWGRSPSGRSRGRPGSIGAATVSGLEEQVSAHPEDAELLTRLGFAYQLRWRETADRLVPAALGGRAATRRRGRRRRRVGGPRPRLARAFVRHDFRAALAHGRRAQQLLPGSARPFGVVGDALVELGRYGEAFRAFERMVELRLGLASYASRTRAS